MVMRKVKVMVVTHSYRSLAGADTIEELFLQIVKFISEDLCPLIAPLELRLLALQLMLVMMSMY